MSESTPEIADLKQENVDLKVQLNIVLDLLERTAIRGQISANTSRITFLEQQQFIATPGTKWYHHYYMK